MAKIKPKKSSVSMLKLTSGDWKERDFLNFYNNQEKKILKHVNSFFLMEKENSAILSQPGNYGGMIKGSKSNTFSFHTLKISILILFSVAIAKIMF